MNKKIIAGLLVLITAGALATSPALAQGNDETCSIYNLSACKEGELIIPSGQQAVCNTAGECVNWAVNLIFIIATLASFLFLVWGGVQYITAAGDEGKVTAARATITNAVIGLIVVIVSWAISNFVLNFFGASKGGLPTSTQTSYQAEGNHQG